jgi:hypothetical protein
VLLALEELVAGAAARVRRDEKYPLPSIFVQGELGPVKSW